MEDFMHYVATELMPGATSSEATAFFTALDQAHTDAAGSWMDFIDKLPQEAQQYGVTDQLAREVEQWLDNNGQLGELDQLFGRLGIDDVVNWYQSLAGGGEHEGGEQQGEQQVGAVGWDAFLQEYGPSFDGSDEYWPTWRDWLLAAAQSAGYSEPASQFVQECDGSQDKRGVFAAHGVELPVQQGNPNSPHENEGTEHESAEADGNQ